MSKPAEPKAAFIAELAQSIEGKTFARLTLGKYRGDGEARQAVLTLTLVKNAPHLKLVTRLARNDDTKTFSINDGINHVKGVIGKSYQSATLFSEASNTTLTYSRKGVPQLVVGKPTETAAAPAAHDREKQYLVSADRPYLIALGVSDNGGNVKPTMHGKYRQICRFIEIFDGLSGGLDAHRPAALEIFDIGAGKGYLTFALYDHLTKARRLPCRLTGIERRADLVAAGNTLAQTLGFTSLQFAASEAATFDRKSPEVVIALHACDTATDDALAMGIHAEAEIILSAPCCQHELAPQMASPEEALKGLTKFPLFKQRQADLVTDAARALLLEASGYEVKIIEFVATEHTAKNILIAAVRSATVDRGEALNQYRELKQAAGFKHHHLASQLKDVD